MLSSANRLYWYRKFVVPVYHYPQFKANLVQYFLEIELTHLKQICDNVFAMLICWTKISSSDKPQTHTHDTTLMCILKYYAQV